MLCTLAFCYTYAEGIDDFALGVLYIGGNSTLEAAAQAEHDINNSSLLPAGYRIQIIAEESKVSRFIWVAKLALSNQRLPHVDLHSTHVKF